VTEVFSDDLTKLRDACNSLLSSQFTSLKIVTPPQVSRAETQGDLYRLLLDEHVIGIKRRSRNPSYVRREVIVHNLRRLCGMSDYSVLKMKGVKLRSTATKTNCTPFEGWEDSDLVLIYFGRVDRRRNFADLKPADIHDIVSFFQQCGEWCAFNYVIGASDRGFSNFVYDLDTTLVYSIDNEERPINAQTGNFPEFDREVRKFRIIVDKFLPTSDDGKQKVRVAFKKGCFDRWLLIRQGLNHAALIGDPELSARDAEPDVLYCKAVLEQGNPLDVVTRINL